METASRSRLPLALERWTPVRLPLTFGRCVLYFPHRRATRARQLERAALQARSQGLGNALAYFLEVSGGALVRGH